MKKWLVNFKIPTPIFIGLALGALALVGILYFLMPLAVFSPVNLPQESADRYYLNEEYDDGDPLMTKNPDLGDMLAGPIISAADPSLGQAGAEIVIVEFADFTCDYCFRQEAAIRQVVEKYQGQIRLVWKDYPDRNKDSLSYQAALAARCAAAQNNFWAYHDRLFAREGKISNDDFIALAAELKLDLADFQACLSRPETEGLVDDNIAEADALDIRGVPFIYVNDREIMGEVSEAELEQLITLAKIKS